jgi:hypothetical protein
MRILVDTNIWRYILDAKAAGRILRAIEASPHEVQVAPSVLYETLRIRHAQLRKRHVDLLTDRRLTRLMPEAFAEAEELRGEISEIRPAWLRPIADFNSFNTLKKDWSRKAGGFWQRCRKSPDSERAILQRLGDDKVIARARDQTYSARDEMLKANWKHFSNLNEALVTFDRKMPGWRGEPVHQWRVSGWNVVTEALTQPRHPYRDWLAPFVDIRRPLSDPAEWLAFWLYEVRADRMPRFWIRWALEFCQRFRTPSAGSPCDVQLGTYTFDTDIIVSSDDQFIKLLNHCRPYAPANFGVGVYVQVGAPAVESVFAQLARA